MDSKITYGIIGTLSLLLTSGAIYELQQDKAYFCKATNEVGVFEKLSSTGKTGYWTENNTLKSKQCSTIWDKLVNNLPSPSKQYLCSFDGCVPK
jgi:hypothetical protein